MRQPHIDDFVRVTVDVPQQSVNKGEVGVVRSVWFAPAVAYEVEFHKIGNDYQTRCLLSAEQLMVEEGAIGTDSNATSEFVAPS
jgi:hypothetical protein